MSPSLLLAFLTAVFAASVLGAVLPSAATASWSFLNVASTALTCSFVACAASEQPLPVAGSVAPSSAFVRLKSARIVLVTELSDVVGVVVDPSVVVVPVVVVLGCVIVTV